MLEPYTWFGDNTPDKGDFTSLDGLLQMKICRYGFLLGVVGLVHLLALRSPNITGAIGDAATPYLQLQKIESKYTWSILPERRLRLTETKRMLQ